MFMEVSLWIWSICIGTKICCGELSLALLLQPQQQRNETAAPYSVYTAHPNKSIKVAQKSQKWLLI